MMQRDARSSAAEVEAETLPSAARIVIIGAGIVGCSVAYHLALLGLTDVLVIDQGPLFTTGGSTSHAPGLVFQTNASRTMSLLAAYSVRLYCSLERADGSPCFLPVGSMEVAQTLERWADLHRKLGWARSWGIPGELLTPEQAQERLPLLNTEIIHGAFHVPTDGIAKAVSVCEAMAKHATEAGVRFLGETEVTRFEIVSGRVRGVVTNRGPVKADRVLLCGGIWGPRLAKQAGISLPLMPVQHQYVRSSPLAALAGEEREVVHPILRHQDKDLYLRQHGDAYGIGSYQHEPLLVEPEHIRSGKECGPAPDMPSVLPFTPEHFSAPFADAYALIPALRDAALAYRINGIFSFTPDGLPLLGESSVRGLWVAEAVWVTHGGGVGAAVASWLAKGVPTLDGNPLALDTCDINRFEGHAFAPSYIRARADRQYAEVYDIIHPRQQMEQPRPLKVSPFYEQQRELGAVFFESGGWERPQWYDTTPLLPDSVPGIVRHNAWSARHWSPRIAEEHRAARERVALFDMTPLQRLEVAGSGALDFLQRMTTSDLAKPIGTVTYTLLCNERGGILSDITVARQGEETFLIGCNGPRDYAYLKSHLPADHRVSIRDITRGTCGLGLWGPLARTVAQRLTEEDLSGIAFPYLTGQHLFLGEIPVWAQRISYVGESGWEFYTDAAYGLRLWGLLWEAGQEHGLTVAGRGALQSLRLEKGYRFFGIDITAEYSPYEAGLGFAVRLDKDDFVGKDALASARSRPVPRRLCCLILDDPTQVLSGGEPIWDDATVVGYITSADFGYTVGKSIAYGWLPANLAYPGKSVAVEYFGERLDAQVAREPLFDPRNERLKNPA